MTLSTTGTAAARCTLQSQAVATQAEAAATASHPRATADRRTTLMRSDEGLATAEYAIATLAAVGFAALLVAVLSSGEIQGMLMSLISNALTFG